MRFLDRLRSLTLSLKTLIILGIVLLAVLATVVGYYAASWYSVNQVSVHILTVTRAVRSNDVNYTVKFQIFVPGAIVPVGLWTPTVSLSVDSYLLGGTFPCWSSDTFHYFGSGDSYTCEATWRARFASPPLPQAVLEARSNRVDLYSYFYETHAGWYASELVRIANSTQTWN